MRSSVVKPMGLEPTRRAFLGTVAGIAAAGAFATLVRTLRVAGAPPRTAAVISLGEPDTLLAGASTSAVALWIYSFIGNGLVKFRYPAMDVERDLAESWTVSPDARTYTFTLRRGVQWQDGRPFSAEDVKFTYELWAHPEWPTGLTPALIAIDGAQAYREKKASEISGIKLLSADRISFTLNEPSTVFLASLARDVMLPRHILRDVAPADAPKHPFARRPVYTGPFQVESWRTGESLTFAAFSEHFAGRPRLEAIIGRRIPDAAVALAELRAGGLSLRAVSADHFEGFARDPAFRTQQLAGSESSQIRLDLTNPLFSDRRVRQAISHAIDRRAVIDNVFRRRAEPSSSIISPTSWIANPNIPKFEFNIEKARSLLDEAAWKIGSDGVRLRNGRRFEFTMNCTPNSREHALLLQPFLRNVGLAAKIDVLEFGTYSQRINPGTYEARYGGWVNFINDPRIELQRFYLTPRPFDLSGYRNDRVDRLFKQARSVVDRGQEKRLYGEIQEIVARDAVEIHLWRPQDLLVTRSNLVVPEVKVLAELYASAPRWDVRS